MWQLNVAPGREFPSKEIFLWSLMAVFLVQVRDLSTWFKALQTLYSARSSYFKVYAGHPSDHKAPVGTGGNIGTNRRWHNLFATRCSASD